MTRARLVQLETTALLSNERISERAYLLYSRGRGAEEYLRLLSVRRDAKETPEVGAGPILGTTEQTPSLIGY